jgi:hypothetical protein
MVLIWFNFGAKVNSFWGDAKKIYLKVAFVG